jgi:hypothetical protein
MTQLRRAWALAEPATSTVDSKKAAISWLAVSVAACRPTAPVAGEAFALLGGQFRQFAAHAGDPVVGDDKRQQVGVRK